MIPKVNFFGIPVSAFSRNELKSVIIDSVHESNKRVIYGFSLHSIYSLLSIPEIIELGKEADVVVVDGRPFYWLLKLCRIQVDDNISIPETVFLTLEIAEEQKFSVMLFGSTEELNKKANKNISNNFHNIKVLEGQHGYFDFSKDWGKILEKINNNNPDVLLVGISSPAKEEIAFKHLDEISSRIVIPCGGMIDVLAGKTKMTPSLLKKMGLASLYRLVQEPRRLLVDRLKCYFFVFFKLFPVLFWQCVVQRKRNFSLIDHFRK